MQLLLDLEGINLILGISNYVYSTGNSYDYWTKNFVGISSQHINYEINGEILECCEVEQLKEGFKRLLNDEKLECTEISFMEPDLEFKLQPSYQLKPDEGDCIYVAPGHEHIECSAELVINLFLKGALSGHSIRLFLDRGDIEKIYNYLRLVTKEIDASNPVIVEYINKGVMLDLQH